MRISLFLLSLLVIPLYALELRPTGRGSFVRDEKGACLTVQISGNDAASLSEVVWQGKTIKVPANAVVKLPVETRLFPGTYKETLKAGDQSFELSWTIGPQLPDDIPVLLWGFKRDHKALQDMGFNCGIKYRSLMADARNFPTLERAIADGFRYLDSITTNGIKTLRQDYPCVKRDGTPGVRSVDASNPEVVRQMLEWVDNFPNCSHPAAIGSLLNSEVRASGTRPSFVPHQIAAWKKFSGKDVPPEVNERIAPHYRHLKNFPADRVVPDDHPLLEYYKWFWRTGDGWNNLNSRMAEKLRKKAGHKFICFHDPIVRTPPIWGSGGNMDAVNHWTYAYPDPFRIVSHIDSMFAMVKGKPEQQVWAMTQIICYRSRLTNRKIKPAVLPKWAADMPKADYISIPPDNLQEAIWAMISRPVKGILFHGEGSLVPMPINKKKLKNYFCTNSDTSKAMKKMLTGTVKPLAATLKRLGEKPSEFAILHSFASTIFANRGTWGSGGWPDDLSLLMYRAGFNPRVIYEEEILRDGLDGIKVLAMPHCDVLTENVLKKVKEFQQRGGIIIGDPDLCPALVPQVLVSVMATSTDADKRERRIRKAVGNLRKELKPYIKLKSATDKFDLLRFERSWKNTSYYFVINDKRSFGDYVGVWKAVKEKGSPNSGVLTVNGKAGAVYELARGGKAAFTVKGNNIEIPLSFDTNDGRIFLPLAKPIAKIKLIMPEQVIPGREFTVKAEILDSTGKCVPALLPVSFSITDSNGKTMDRGPYGCAVDGVFSYTAICPLNASGEFTFNLTCRASQLNAAGKMKIGKGK